MKLQRIIEEKRKQAERSRKREAAKKVAVGTALGTALGAAAGLLFAPKSGKETREDITKASKDVADNLKVKVNDQIENTKDWSGKVKTEVKQNWEEFKEKKKDVVEDTVVAAEILKEEVTEGLANVGEILKESKDSIIDDLNS